jgi:hypothetical protein
MRFSAFLLERYHLGELTADEQAAVEAALAEDPGLAASVADLEQSDAEIRRRYPLHIVFPERVRESAGKSGRVSPRKFPVLPGFPALAWGLCAAALILVVALPALFLFRSPAGVPSGFPSVNTDGSVPLTDRIKGNGQEGSFTELSVYLKTDLKTGQGTEEQSLAEEAALREGDTIQLAYIVPGGVEQYGVIFSIDGRAALTVHYPYRTGQSARLITGRRIALDEAYTLDDAPDYEIFFFVSADKPLDVEKILESAAELARNPGASMEAGKQVFQQYQLRTVKIRKE